MRNRTLVLLIALVVLVPVSALALPPSMSTVTTPDGVAMVHDTAYIQSGELLMMVNNQGSFGYDRTGFFGKNDGLHYPGTCTTTVMFASGLWLGARVGDQIRVSTSEYQVDYMPGTIVGGVASPDNPQFRVYKIGAGDTKFTNVDYAEWPFADGAPVVRDHEGNDLLDADGDRIPLLKGDEAIWTAFNDADMSGHNSDPGSGSIGPLGVEVQLYAYAYDSTGDSGRIIFMHYTLINQGGNSLDSMHVAFWADPDLGDAGDDLVGCDTVLNIGYCYNADDDDAVYGDKSPTVGFGLINGPIVPSPGGIAWQPGTGRWIPGYRNLEMTAFSKYINGTDPSINIETWNYMRGHEIDGSTTINPVNGLPTNFMVSGNPVNGTGWLDYNAADRRYMMTTGSFTMQSGDTQEVVIAVMVGSTYPFDCHIGIFTETINATHDAGTSGGRAFALIASPDSTSGHDYQITFTGPVDNILWHLWDVTLGQVVAADQTNVSGKGAYPYVDGMLVKVIGYRPGIGSWEIPNGTRRFTWAGADAFQFEGFNGAMTWNSPCHFFGVCDEPGVPANRLRRVLLKLAATDSEGSFDDTDPNVSYAYRYLRNATGAPARPEFVPFIINQTQNYGFQSFEKSVPLSAWDIDANPARRLVVGHLENNVNGGLVDGKYWPPLIGAADNTATVGPREWLWIFDTDYSEIVDAEFTGSALTDQLPVMYMSTAALRSVPFETGDEFLIIPVDSNLFFSEADTFSFTSPLPGLSMAGTNVGMNKLASITDLRHLDSVAQAKFEETNWTCACPCLADPTCAGGNETAINVMDIVGFIDVAFRGIPAVNDRPCPTERTDVNCDYLTDIRDVVTAIDVAFRGADPELRFCNPCNQP